MPTIVDALIVTLGLDAKGFKKESKEVNESLEKTSDKSKKSGQDVADALDKKATAAMTRLKNEALAVTGVLLGATGLKDWIANTVQANVSTGNLSKSIGMSANDLNAWRHAAELAGGNADDMQGAMQSMGAELQKFRLKGVLEGPLKALSQMGFRATDAAGKIISVQDAMKQVANMMGGHDYQAVFQVLHGEFGFGAGVVPLLSKGGDAVQQSVLDMHRLGDVTDNAYQSSEKLNEEWVKLKASVGSTASELEHKFEPVLTRIIEAIRHVSESAKDAVKETPDAKPYAPRNNAAANVKLPGWVDYIFGNHSQRSVSVGGSAAPTAGATSGSAFNPLSFLLSNGWDKEQSAGILANLIRESGMNPGAVGDNGKAYGIAQWHQDRQADFQKWSGKSIVGSTVAEQMAFMLYEMTGGKEKTAGDKLHGSHQRSQVAALMSMLYERPADVFGEASKRANLANSDYGTSIINRLSPGGGTTTINNSSETHIGEINVHTKATDANGIAKDMRQALSKNALVMQADSGMR